MKKVDQTIVCKDRGNCLQAAVASLLNLELEQVPNFIESKRSWFLKFMEFMGTQGYPQITPYNVIKGQIGYPSYKEVAHVDGGVDCYFLASVPSQTFPDVTHAVIVNQDMIVIHDPNPNRKALQCTEDDIIDIITVSGNWHIDLEGKIVKYNEKQKEIH